MTHRFCPRKCSAWKSFRRFHPVNRRQQRSAFYLRGYATTSTACDKRDEKEESASQLRPAYHFFRQRKLLKISNPLSPEIFYTGSGPAHGLPPYPWRERGSAARRREA
jgi:hypothetical protein